MADATLCFSGFSRDEIAQVQSQFEQANASLALRWTLAGENDAKVLIIDMDSMYGHMTWLKAHGSGKTTVGLTSGERSETDHLLKRPLSVEALAALLATLSGGAMPAAAAAAPVTPVAPRVDEAPPVATEVQASSSTSVPDAVVVSPEPAPTPTAAVVEEPIEATRARPSADYMAALTTGQMRAMHATVPHEPRISDYLPKGVLGGPSKIQLPGAPVLAFDPATQTYAGSATLKPLLPYVQAVVQDSDLEAIDGAEFDRIKAASGGPQPYMRLLWLCGLTVGAGQLLPGYQGGKKFQLTKWPQIEREYPKHFRLATVMMKGPAQVKDIAEASGVPEPDVVDFINAGLLTGYVVQEGTTSVAGDVARASALLAKPR